MLDLKEIKKLFKYSIAKRLSCVADAFAIYQHRYGKYRNFGFLPIYACVLSMYLTRPFPDIDFLLLYMFIIVKLN